MITRRVTPGWRVLRSVWFWAGLSIQLAFVLGAEHFAICTEILMSLRRQKPKHGVYAVHSTRTGRHTRSTERKFRRKDFTWKVKYPDQPRAQKRVVGNVSFGSKRPRRAQSNSKPMEWWSKDLHEHGLAPWCKEGERNPWAPHVL